MTAPARTRLAIAAIACALTLTGLAGCGNDDTVADETNPAGGSPSANTSGSEPPESTAPSPTEGSSAPGDPEDPVTVPVYFVGDTPQGLRLYREFRAVPADNPLEEAAALIAAGDALDPDYRTLWTPGDFGDIGLDEEEDRFMVVLPDDTTWTERGDLSKLEARLAVQQLVLTLQGIAQTRDPVRALMGDDAAPTTLFGIDTSNGVKNAPQLDVLAFVNVTAPEEGSTVSGAFTASGVASSFEATVPWEIRQGARVVKTGFATAEGWMDKLYPWATEIDVSELAPGDYTFVALTDDPSGGEGGGPTQDSKSITVE